LDNLYRYFFRDFYNDIGSRNFPKWHIWLMIDEACEIVLPKKLKVGNAWFSRMPLLHIKR